MGQSFYYLFSAYADDLVVFVKNQDDVNVLTDTVTNVGKISSVKVKWDKSEALLCGKWEGRTQKLPQGLKWGRNGLKYLGVFWVMIKQN